MNPALLILAAIIARLLARAAYMAHVADCPHTYRRTQ